MSKYYTLRRILPSTLMCITLFELAGYMNNFIAVQRLEICGALFMLYASYIVVNRIYKYLKEDIVYKSFNKNIISYNIKQLMYSLVFLKVYFIINIIRFRIIINNYRGTIIGKDFIVSLVYYIIFFIICINVVKIQYSRSSSDYRDLAYRYFNIKIL